jgi:hypothetical protein
MEDKMAAPAKHTTQLFVVAVALIAAPFISSAQAQSQDATSATQPAPAVAQVTTPAAATAVAAAAPNTIVLKEGTEVPLIFASDLSSKTAVDDDPVNLTLADDLKVGDVIVARKGAAALGTVSSVHKSGALGKAGDLAIRLEYVKAGDARVKIRGTKGKEGEGKVGATVALTVLLGPVGLLKHGKNVEIAQGTPVTAFVDQDYSLAPLN